MRNGSSHAKRLARAMAWAVVAAAGLACAPSDPRPSIVLVVIDTLRASAVSAYGQVEGTTPTLDALAAEGVRYTNALAPAPWTLPSHSSLLTGFGVEVHRVGMPSRVTLDESIVTLAERFRDAGYETVAFSENNLVSDDFHELQGFDYRRASHIVTKADGAVVDHLRLIDLLGEMRLWVDARRGDGPFFLFVNIFDAHQPYTVREQNPWVPATASRARVERRPDFPDQQLCAAAPGPEDFEILRGLYRGDVHQADRKLAQVLRLAREAAGLDRLVTVVTSDHGELFGDHGLAGHEYSVRRGVLEIPLVVHGAGVAPAVVDAPVTLVDVAPSLLRWAGLPVPADLPGRVLPLTPEAAAGEPERTRIAAYTDGWPQSTEPLHGAADFRDLDRARKDCGPTDKVRGGMISLSRPPYRLYWFERYAPELYDERWDAGERTDQTANQPEIVASLMQEIEPFARRAGLLGEASAEAPATAPGPEAIESLKALGYVE